MFPLNVLMRFVCDLGGMILYVLFVCVRVWFLCSLCLCVLSVVDCDVVRFVICLCVFGEFVFVYDCVFNALVCFA